MRYTLIMLLAGLASFSTGKERINDFSIEGSLLYTVDTILQIPFGDGLESLGKPRMPYFGPRAFDVDWTKQVCYIFQAHDKVLRSYNFKGKFLYKKDISYPVFDLRIYNDNLYVFDGSSIHILKSENGDSLRRIDIAPLATRPIKFANVSFFYNRFLILGDFDFRKWRSGLCYLYDLKTERLSNNISDTDRFLPITNCASCKQELLQRIVYDTVNDPSKGTFDFEGQSEKFLIFSYFPGKGFSYESPKTNADTYILSKSSGNIKRLERFRFMAASSTGPKSFIFVDDTTAIFPVVNYDKTAKRFRPLVLNKLTFQY